MKTCYLDLLLALHTARFLINANRPFKPCNREMPSCQGDTYPIDTAAGGTAWATMTLTMCTGMLRQPLVPTLGPHCVDNLASDSQQLFPAFAFAWVCVRRQELLHLCRQFVHGRLVSILCGQPFAKGLVMFRQALRDIPPHGVQE